MGEKNKNNLKEATKRFCEDIEASLSKGELKGFKIFIFKINYVAKIEFNLGFFLGS